MARRLFYCHTSDPVFSTTPEDEVLLWDGDFETIMAPILSCGGGGAADIYLSAKMNDQLNPFLQLTTIRSHSCIWKLAGVWSSGRLGVQYAVKRWMLYWIGLEQ